MATFDQLSAEQRAIIELILKQGRSYDELGDMLGMSTARVQELARESLLTLSPVSGAAVDEDWRGAVADYLLNQQSGTDSALTRGHLRRSEGARVWSRSLLDSLDQFYDRAGLPTIPDGGAGARTERDRDGQPEGGPAPKELDRGAGPAAAELSPEARAAVRRRQIAGVGAIALVAVAALVLGAMKLFGDDDEGGDSSRRSAPRVVAQLVLEPVGGAQGGGVAVVAARGDRRQLIVQARLTPSANREAYEVWLYNSKRDANTLGAQVTDRQGTFQGAGDLPNDFTRYKYIDVSREKVDEDARHSGKSVLRGRVADLRAPPAGANGGQSTTPVRP